MQCLLPQAEVVMHACITCEQADGGAHHLFTQPQVPRWVRCEEKLPLYESKAFTPSKRIASGVTYMHPEGGRRVGWQELFTSLPQTGSHPAPAFCTNTIPALDRILLGLKENTISIVTRC